MRIKNLLSVLVLSSLLVSCNIPIGQGTATQQPEAEPASLDMNAMATAVELTASVKLTEIASSMTATFTPEVAFTPTLTATPAATSVPAQCSPLITANVVVNVRSGPDTAYDVVGSLPQGGTATIVGRNDAYTWWYIDYPAGSGNHAWVAGSVVTSACVPSTVQVVAAPALPTAAPTKVSDSNDDDNNDSGTPDLVASGMQYYVVSGKKVHVMVKVTNTGDGTAGSFIVNWTANQDLGGCHWTMTKLAAGKSKDLECDYTYTWGAKSYWSVLTVDSDGTVKESNEGNNSKDFKVDL
ncbi:MAG TPA: CARDB domain-containing protein [Anaerolineales bacterium]|nr:CARDB domain-containing protein [Anaerolineales bacterium]